ncbi:hypothetical protein [Mangrovimonas sp. DI 80]|uniref:hypothetical protein n=1 Tax=Mangrovimonas sp. DI 80 TaxID=1779330 RepID=UPI0009762F09|nr:hypothetical protein [Mangrovimonas sp. DI 80]OMP32296.1 hypothetical protein BKM32_04395 [Mangrovimonas sp. DI 80]
MKIAVILLLILSFQTSINYNFDYRLEYEIENNRSDSIKNVNYYINSSDNSYYADIRNDSNKRNQLYFRDQDKLTALATLDRNYKKLNSLVIPKNFTNPFDNIYEKKAKKYVIETLNDTIINNKNCSRVIFKMTNAKKANKNKLACHIYVIDTSTPMQPFLAEPTILNIWRLHKNMPQGLIIEKQVYNNDGKLYYVEKLKKVTPINFRLIIE